MPTDAYGSSDSQVGGEHHQQLRSFSPCQLMYPIDHVWGVTSWCWSSPFNDDVQLLFHSRDQAVVGVCKRLSDELVNRDSLKLKLLPRFPGEQENFWCKTVRMVPHPRTTSSLCAFLTVFQPSGQKNTQSMSLSPRRQLLVIGVHASSGSSVRQNLMLGNKCKRICVGRKPPSWANKVSKPSCAPKLTVYTGEKKRTFCSNTETQHPRLTRSVSSRGLTVGPRFLETEQARALFLEQNHQGEEPRS